MRVEINGTVVPATIDRSLGAVHTSDTVETVHMGGTYRVVRIVTWREPEPVSTEAELPLKPDNPISTIATTSYSPVGLNGAGVGPGNSTQQIYDYLWDWLIPAVNSHASAIGALQAFASTSAGRLNSVRTSLIEADAANVAGNNYTENTGSAAAGAASSTADAAVESGTARRVQGFGMSEAPENIDRTGYEQWDQTTQRQATRMLAWRTSTLYQIREAVNRGLAYRKLTQVPAFPTVPSVTLDDLSWTSAASQIGLVDDWCTNRIGTLMTAINTLRADQTFGAYAYSGGTTSWVGGTYQAARPQLIVSFRNYRIRCSELGSALKDPINRINGR
ncbi:hypothetical protein AOA12_19930 [Microbacterium sp. No. 7]|nr:hypothetical protein AOA12_19930 [Microbacterium sp. No. 7]